MKRVPLLRYNRSEVRGVWYDSLATTRPIRLGADSHPKDTTFVPRAMRCSDGRTYPWTVLADNGPGDNEGWRSLKITGAATQHQVDELRRLDRLDRSAEHVTLLERLGAWDESWQAAQLAVMTVDVPAAGIRAGDVLMRAYAEEDRPEPIRGHWFGLSLEDYATLRDAVREAGDGALREITPRYVSRRYTVRAFIEDSRTWGHRLKRWHSRLYVVRPFTHAVSAPIYAVSDEAAIFDLLTDVGCRMPVGGTS